MAMASSYADLYRQCIEIEKPRNIPLPSYAWFLLQCWQTTKTASSVRHYTGHFKVKRMVQARVLRKNNPDSHYANAVYSFLNTSATKCNDTTFTSMDAKCKISVGEPGYPIALQYLL